MKEKEKAKVSEKANEREKNKTKEKKSAGKRHHGPMDKKQVHTESKET